VERGTPGELLERGGEYAEVARLQSVIGGVKAQSRAESAPAQARERGEEAS